MHSQHLLTVDFLLTGSIPIPEVDDLINAQGRPSCNIPCSQELPISHRSFETSVSNAVLGLFLLRKIQRSGANSSQTQGAGS